MLKLNHNQKVSLKYLRKLVKPCKCCGNTNPRFDNLRGWTNVTIVCNKCWKQKTVRSTVEEAIEAWNKLNKED